MMLPLAKISLLMHGMIVLFIAIAVLLILVILIQKGKGGGMGAMFGGMGASSLLGSKTGDFLTWVTISLVALFLVLAVLMDKYLKTQITSDLMVPPAQAQPMTESSAATEPTAKEAIEATAQEVQEVTEESAAEGIDASTEAIEEQIAQPIEEPVEEPEP